ncbi:MAG: glycine cleavage system protein GcvH [Chloroflexota bacterium]|nr:glycine cleavage system protein GcvH [Chloroflexota bacterium]
MKLDPEARYTETHEWARLEGDEVVCGITDHAQETLSDVVYVELPMVGDVFDAGDPYGIVESVKAASDLYAPVSGEVTAVNEELEGAPELVNQDPYGEGWTIRLDPSDPDELDDLMGPDEYETFAEEEEG